MERVGLMLCRGCGIGESLDMQAFLAAVRAAAQRHDDNQRFAAFGSRAHVS